MMRNKTQEVGEDVKSLVEDALALMAATADVAEERVVEARTRLGANLDKRQVYGTVRERIVGGAKKVDKVVKDHPYQAIGIALGVGALVGLILMSKRNR